MSFNARHAIQVTFEYASDPDTVLQQTFTNSRTVPVLLLRCGLILRILRTLQTHLPKSISFKGQILSSEETSMFSGLISLCMIPALCSCTIEHKSSPRTCMHQAAGETVMSAVSFDVQSPFRSQMLKQSISSLTFLIPLSFWEMSPQEWENQTAGLFLLLLLLPLLSLLCFASSRFFGKEKTRLVGSHKLM